MNQQIIDDQGFCPSFNCYSSDNPVSLAATRISNEIKQDEFEFKDIDSKDPMVFPLFNRDLLNTDECTDTLQNLFITEREEDQESSSSESESEGEPSGVFCVWNTKHDTGYKKSSSTGSGSKRWRIRDLLRRSNSEGKDPMMLLSRDSSNNIKKVENIVKGKQVSRRSERKQQPSVHELFYVQQRAKHEHGKRKSYLPYRQGLVGLFMNVNGKGKQFGF